MSSPVEVRKCIERRQGVINKMQERDGPLLREIDLFPLSAFLFSQGVCFFPLGGDTRWVHRSPQQNVHSSQRIVLQQRSEVAESH